MVKKYLCHQMYVFLAFFFPSQPLIYSAKDKTPNAQIITHPYYRGRGPLSRVIGPREKGDRKLCHEGGTAENKQNNNTTTVQLLQIFTTIARTYSLPGFVRAAKALVRTVAAPSRIAALLRQLRAKRLAPLWRLFIPCLL